MRSKIGVAAVAAALVLPGPLAAQAWDAPAFLPSHPSDELGVFLFEPQFGSFALAGIWRQTGDLNLGVRAAYLNLEDETGFAVGSDFYGPLIRPTRDAPYEAVWALGIGATFNTGTLVRIPAGISAGTRLGGEDGGIAPFVHPRAALDFLVVDDESITEINLAIDVGADVMLGRTIVLRLAASFLQGGENAFGAGVAVLRGRRVEVR